MANQSAAASTANPARTPTTHANAYQPAFTRPDTLQEIFVNDTWTNLLRRTEIACAQMQPLVVITGEAGTGKSTMARWLYETLPLNNHEVMMISLIGREIQTGWLVPKIAKFLGVTTLNTNANDTLTQTLEKLEELIQEKRSLTVLIDAADKLMTAEAFGEIEALLNLQSLAGRCLTFILIGTKTLLTQLQNANSLSTHLSLNCDIGVLSRKDSREYISSRLRLAGANIAKEVTPEALDAVHNLSKGVIARVNSLMENCLVEAAIGKREIIDGPFVYATVKQALAGVELGATQTAAVAEKTKQPNVKSPSDSASKTQPRAKRTAKDKTPGKTNKKKTAPRAAGNTKASATPPAATGSSAPALATNPSTKPAIAKTTAPGTAGKKPKIALTDLFNDDE